MKKAAKFIVNGTVQGVFFRQFSKENADRLNIKGFVRNLEDGNLEVVAEGDNNELDEFEEVLKQGPPHSQIRNVSTEERKWSGEFKEFKVLRF